MPDASGRPAGGAKPRSVALIGPQGSGKSTLFDALIAAAGGPARRGGPRGMGTELRLGHASHLGDPWSLLDCPGSVEFAHDAACAVTWRTPSVTAGLTRSTRSSGTSSPAPSSRSSGGLAETWSRVDGPQRSSYF